MGGILTDQSDGRGDIDEERLTDELRCLIARIICAHYANVQINDALNFDP